jgi:hypothetical protein
MALTFQRCVVVALWVTTFGLVALYAPESALGQVAVVATGLTVIVIASIAGADLWNAAGHRRTDAIALAASDAIDLERLDSDKG